MAMVPAVSSELFGLKYFGIFYNVFTCALPIGSYVFSGLLAGYIYDEEAAKEASGGSPHLGLLNLTSDSSVCHGAHCFQLTFIIMALVCLLATLADIWLVIRTYPVYQRLYPRSTRQQRDNRLT